MQIINERSTTYLESNGFPILILEGGVTYSKIKNCPTTYNVANDEGNLLITAYKPTNNDKDTVLTTIIGSSLLRDRYSIMYILYIISFAIIDMIIDVAKKIPSAKIANMLTFLYKVKYEHAGGEIYLLQSHTMTITHYIYQISSTVSLLYTIDADIGLEPNQIGGEINPESCNFMKSSDGFVEIDYLPIIVIQDMSLYQSKIIYQYLKLYIDKKNSDGTVLGKSFIPVNINLKIGVDSIFKKV